MRLNVFEFCDFQWLPHCIRDAATDYLTTMLRLSGHSALIARQALGALREVGARSIIDFGSGGTGPTMTVVEELSKNGFPGKVWLTDLQPNLLAFERARARLPGTVEYCPEPVRAGGQLPESLRRIEGVRTYFNCLHHFPEADVAATLADAEQKQQPVLVIEVAGRSALTLLMMVSSLFMVPFFMLAVRPLRWNHLVFTYLVPILPVLIAWDGFASCWRVYGKRDLQRLVGGFDKEHYTWSYGTFRLGSAPLYGSYLVGKPLRSRTA
jgi:hypothetical protein